MKLANLNPRFVHLHNHSKNNAFSLDKGGAVNSFMTAIAAFLPVTRVLVGPILNDRYVETNVVPATSTSGRQPLWASLRRLCVFVLKP